MSVQKVHQASRSLLVANPGPLALEVARTVGGVLNLLEDVTPARDLADASAGARGRFSARNGRRYEQNDFVVGRGWRVHIDEIACNRYGGSRVQRQQSYLTTAELADLCRTSPETARYWRHVGKGPRSFKVGRRVLYDTADVEAWLEEAKAKAKVA